LTVAVVTAPDLRSRHQAMASFLGLPANFAHARSIGLALSLADCRRVWRTELT